MLAGFVRSSMILLLTGVFSVLLGLNALSAQAQTIDLSLTKAISKQNPAIGEVVTYTIVVANASGMATATNVQVTDQLLADGATYVPASATASSGTFTSTSSATYTTGIWTIPSITAGASATLAFQVTVQAPGVWFGMAEVTAADQTDADSQPNNQVIAEDDYEAVCFAMPIVWYPGDEYTVSVPTGYDQVIWFRNDVPISTTSVSTTLATANSDNSLTIKGPGTYRVETYKNGCQSGNCCNIQLIEGQLGSIGQVVWDDKDANGKKDNDEPGIDGVVVELWDAATNTMLASTTTTAGGVYSFTGLSDGSYALRFQRPTGYTTTTTNAPGVSDEQNSDANSDGFTRTYVINTTAPESSTARNNPTVYAGFVEPASLGGKFVFADNDRNNVQSPGDTPIAGVKVTLYINGTPTSQTALTSQSGLYSFTGLTPGNSYSYSVGFTVPTGYTAVTPLSGTDRNLDSDLLATGQTSSVTLASGESNQSLDAGFILTGYDIVIAKNVAGESGTFRPGDIVTYQLTVTNNSPHPVFNVVVNDQLPTGLNFISGTGFSASSPQSVSTVIAGPLAAAGTSGSTASLTLSAQISNSFLNGTLTNTAFISRFTSVSNTDGFQPTDTNPTSNTATVPVTVTGAPVLAVTINSATCNPATNGYTATGTVSFTNIIPGRLTIRDNGAEIVSLTVTAGQTSASFSLTGVSNGPVSRTVTATLEGTVTLIKSATYAVPQSCTLCNPIALTLSGLRSYTVGAAYSQTVTASGGTAPYTYAVQSGALPAGLTLNPTTGVISGTATVAAVSTFTIVSTDAKSCSGTSPYSLTISPAPTCNVAPPFLVCAIKEICKGGSTTMIAERCEGGTVRWSDQQTGFTVSVSPNVTTTYTATCVIGACTSASSNSITITVFDPQPPVITASASAVCPGTSVTLTASGCEGGTIEWSERTQSGSVIVVEPTTRTTYTAQCVMGSCPGKPATKTIDISTALPTPTVTCSTTIACPGEEVTLTVNGCVGTPVWSSTTLTTGSIVVRPTLGNSSYTVYCQNGTCRSAVSKAYSISVVPASVPNVTASANMVCPGAPISLTATGCNGDVIWNASDRNGNVLTGAVVTVNPQASISYFARCRYRICLGEPSEPIAVTVVNPQTPQISLASGKNVVCSGEKVTLTAEGCDGTVKWYGIDRVGASIDFFPTETKEYYATCKQGSCESDASLKIRVSVTTSGTATAPVVVASTTTICGSGVVSLTATGCTSGTITWSDGQIGPVVSVTATPTYREFYAICKATSGTACGSARSNTININVTEVPTPTVTCSTTIACPGEEVTLTVNGCVGTPVWSSTTLTTGSIVVRPTLGNSTYTVYCQNGTCRSAVSKAYSISVVPASVPTIVASATVVEPGGTVSLSATGCPGDVIWNADDINGNNIGAVIVVRPNGTQTYYAQCRYRICLSEPSLPIVINPGSCVAKAGTMVPVNTTLCAGTAVTTTLAATPNGGLVQPTGYSLLYVLTKGTTQVVQQTSATPTFSVTAAAGDYAIHTLVYTAEPASLNYLDLSVVKQGLTTGADIVRLIAERKVCADFDLTGAKLTVKRLTPPVVTLGSPITVCAGATVAISATGCEGGVIRWSTGDVGATISKIVAADLRMTATCTVDGCTSENSAPVSVLISTPGVPTVSIDRPVVCQGEKVSLTASGCEGGQYIWSDNVTTGSSLTLTATATVSYRVKCKIGQCEGAWSPATTITVGSPAAPIASVGTSGTATLASTTVCFGSPVTLTARGCSTGSTVVWSNNETGASITVSPTASQTYTARCISSSTCQSAPSNTVVVTVLPQVARPQVADRTNTCPLNTVDLKTAVTSATSTAGGVFEYYTSASLTAESKLTSTTVGSGTYYVVEKTTRGCLSEPAVVRVQINTCTEVLPCDPANPATASAGTNATICAAKTYQLAGVMGGAGKAARWTTSGSGTFDNPFLLNATYTASAEDVRAGRVTLTLSVSANNASCPVAKDDMLLTIGGSTTVPVVKVISSTDLCAGDSVRLEAPAGATGYVWSNMARTQSIVVKSSGSYSVQLLDVQGCSSVKSADVVVKVAQPVAAPLVANLRNTCPSVVTNLTSALSATVAGTTYEYRIGTSASSKFVARPDSVGAGTYYVFARTASGCVSAPAKVVVTIANCTRDSLTADLAIAKIASTTSVQRGEPVTYTIRVTNLGKHTVKNIDIRDVLPKGLELVTGGTASYSVANGVITKRLDSLRTGKSDSIVFRARIITKGTVVNTAEITYADLKDPNLANNKASVSVIDTSSYKPSRLGLAKALFGTPKAVGDSVLVSYRFVATNYGDDTLRKVKVVDDLAFFFAPNSVVSAMVKTQPGSTLKPHSAFTGTGFATSLFDSTSYLAPNRSQTFTLDVVIRRATGNTTQSFQNIAQATALNSVTVVSDMSVSGSDPDPDKDGDPTDNTGVTSFTLGVQPPGPGIGLALAVVKVEKQPDNSYNVTYKATLKNHGNVDLVGVSLTDSLVKTFAPPVSYTVVRTQVGTGSTLVRDVRYDGNTLPNVLAPASRLAAGAQDTVLIVVNVRLGDNKGPFLSTATATGTPADSSPTVSDKSNNGFDPAPEGSIATPVRFDLPNGLIGVNKQVGTPVLVSEGIYDIPYTISVKNWGLVPLTNVQVTDSLSETFKGALIVSNSISITAGTGLTVNTQYTGQGLLTKMLVDSLSRLAVGETRSLAFIVRVDVRNADTLTFYNRAKATALTPDRVLVEDLSTTGANADPDNDFDPRNNSIRTPITLNYIASRPYIGVALSVRDTVRQADGSYNVTYQVVVRNYGNVPLTGVAVSDTLTKVFNSSTGASYRVVSRPVSIATGSTLKLNPAYDGGANPLIVLGDSTSTLAAGKADSILVVVNVVTNGSTTTFLSTAYAEAKAGTTRVADVSTNGLNPDVNGNRNPTDVNEGEATPLSLPATNTTLFIPEGFSPNNDGINDLFVIRGVGPVTISLEVYNRWGHLVYKNEDYQNDWDGKPNTGIQISGDAAGLPDGTYYYVIKLSDGRQFVRYMTINR